MLFMPALSQVSTRAGESSDTLYFLLSDDSSPFRSQGPTPRSKSRATEVESAIEATRGRKVDMSRR
jgi:hypothetical protein